MNPTGVSTSHLAATAVALLLLADMLPDMATGSAALQRRCPLSSSLWRHRRHRP
ncbi:hypothetical protein [Hymenobacter weizhouensis]|uniref:hypothetical protein n=1 Tax=Hymenobacter sp. YIM 151500-1 TaxID=2987689 RepID=UPI002227A441|nr:hypothetical protein [Hymenobacter sp. YIM 151500-1]UYZ63717.1 hypothetical protein OIS53_02475 [Hymenobacter sp. YIM 151500-1]